MSEEKVHLRHCILYEFQKGSNAVQAEKNLCEVFGGTAVTARTCQRWFTKFRSGDFSLKDEPRSGRPSDVDDEVLRSMIRENPTLTSVDVGFKLGIHQTTALEHIKRLGFVSKLTVWVPHELSEKNLMDRIAICASNLARQKKEPFLDRLVTGDEKWIVYKNVVRKRAYVYRGETPPSTSKANVHQKKVMLCCWWDCKGPLYYELLKEGETINAERYCEQLDKLNTTIQSKRPSLANRKGVIFHHDNARPHVARKSIQKLSALNWEILPHPPYSPDIAPSDYHLFRSLQNFLDGNEFINFEGVQTAVDEFFASKSEDFFSSGINKLKERWQTVLDNEGNYVLD